MVLTPRPGAVVFAALLAGLLCGCDDATNNGDAASDAGAPNATADAAADVAGAGGTAASAGKGGATAGRASGSDAGSSAAAAREVKIRFRAVVADRAFSCRDEYPDMGATQVRARPADFRFYVQDLKLIDASGDEVPVELADRTPWQTPDVALIDFEDQTGSCHGTAETNELITGTVPEGDYDGVVFTNGVPEELNHLEQSTQPAPLDVTDLYWAWLNGYRFFVAEMQQADTGEAVDEDAGLVLPGTGLVHIGSTACRKDKGCTKHNRNRIRLSGFDPDADVIVADLAAVFADTDLTQDQQCHSAGDSCAPMFERVGVSWETGERLDGAQKVYRVEAREAGDGGR